MEGITEENAEAFKKKYKEAKAKKEDTFMFEGTIIDIGYAKYALEYLDLITPKQNRDE